MKKIIFVTGNERKMGEAKSSCELFDITVEQKSLAIDEIQSQDPLVIAQRKALDAFHLIASPVVVNDAFWSIPSLNGFPGGYMKDICEWFTADDFITITRNKPDRRIILTECVVYKDSEIMKVFTKEFIGTISDSTRGNGNSIEQVAMFNGMTLAEHSDLGQFSAKPEDLVWYDFAQWFSQHLAPK